MGYGRLLRWETGVASRGNMAGLTFGEPKQDAQKHHLQSRPQPTTVGWPSESRVCYEHTSSLHLTALTDPLIQDLGLETRKYLGYCMWPSSLRPLCNADWSDADLVCKDLVLYDVPDRNPFRGLVAMTQSYPMLLHVIVANAALHLSNAGQNAGVSPTGKIVNGVDGAPLRSPSSRWAVVRSQQPYNDALAAKQRGLRSLRKALMHFDSRHTDAILATMLLFTEFELLDSGRDTWKHHISGAREIIAASWKPDLSEQEPMSSLRSALVSNCLVYDSHL